MRNLLVSLSFILLPSIALAQNTPPVANAGPDQTIFLGEDALLYGTATDVDGQVIAAWLWSVDSAPQGSTPELVYPDMYNPFFVADVPGDYVLALVASDGIDWSAPDFVTIHVHEILPPEAVIDVDVVSGPAPLTVHLDGSASFVDPYAGPLNYDWSFGDGGASAEMAPTHVYELPGEYTAVLRVVDNRGQTDLDTIDITAVDPNSAPQPAVDSGRYSTGGFHDPSDTEYEAVVGGSRSFFVFDLSSLTDPRPIVSATLVLDVGDVTQGTFGGIDYTLYAVTTPISTLIAGGSGLVGVYSDLGSGAAYSALTVIDPGDAGGAKAIPLLEPGVAAVRAAKGGQLAIGGSPSGTGGNVAFSGTDVSGATLVIELGDAPMVPALSPGAITLLLVLLAGIGFGSQVRREKGVGRIRRDGA